MIKVNPVKLHKELKDAGLPVISVTSERKLLYSRDLIGFEDKAASEIMRNHDPFDRAAARRKAYLNAGLDAEVLVVALWEKYMEGNAASVEAIQQIRKQIKEQISPSA